MSVHDGPSGGCAGYCDECEQRIRAEAAAEEREACAQMAEELDGVGGGPIIPYSFTELAADIRARGEAPGELAAKFKLGQKVRKFLSPAAPKPLSRTQQRALAIQRGEPDARELALTALHDSERSDRDRILAAIAALEGK